MQNLLMWVIGAAAIAYFLWTVLRMGSGRVAARLGIRRLLSAKAETGAAVGAVGLSVALFFSALLIGESLRASLLDLQRSRLGPIDVSILLRGPASREGAEEIRETLRGKAGLSTITVRALQVTTVSTRSSASGETPEARVDSAEISAEPLTVAFDIPYGELEGFSRGIPDGLPETGPRESAIFMSRTLARNLDLHEGETVELVIGRNTERFEIERILEPEGIAGYSESVDKPILSVFLPQGYLDRIPAVTEVLINLGIPSDASAQQAAAKADEALAELRPVFDGLAARGTRPIVRHSKADLIQAADNIGRSQLSQMLELGAFSLLSALGLLATVLYLLLSERRKVSGVLRAVGMRRRDLAAANDAGALSVAIPGIAGGLLLGSAVAWIAVRIAGRALALEVGGFRAVLSIPFRLTVITGASAVVVTAVLSRMISMIVLSSYPAELISGRERPLAFPVVISIGGGLTLLALGLTAAAIDFRSKNPTFVSLGPPIASAGVALLMLPTRLRRVIVGLAGAFTVGWIAYVEIALSESLQPPEFGALPIVETGALLLGTVAAIVAAIGPLESLATKFIDAAGRRLVGLRSAARSLNVRRGSTWFVIQTSAAAVTVLTMVLGVFVLERADYGRLERAQLGKWDGAVSLQVSGSQDARSIVEDAVSRVGGGDSVETVGLRSTQRFFRVVAGGRQLTRVYEVPAELARTEGGFLPLVGRNAVFGSDEEAWKALFDENPPEGKPWVIMTQGAVELGLVSPASAVLIDAESGKSYGLAGLAARNDIVPGVFVAPETLALQDDSFDEATVLFKLPQHVADADRFAAELQGRLLPYAANATFASQVVKVHLDFRRLVSHMLRAFLSLGLLVAMAAQAAVVTRAVRARIRSLAVLRAMGATRWGIFRSVLAEGATMALLGSLAGAMVGAAVALRLYSRSGGSISVASIAAMVAALVAISTITVGLATILPARSAARVYPAEVLRLPEE